MCDRHTYKWEDATRGMARWYNRKVNPGTWTLRCAVCGQIQTVEATSSGGTPWRHTFKQNIQWAARVERDMLKRRAG